MSRLKPWRVEGDIRHGEDGLADPIWKIMRDGDQRVFESDEEKDAIWLCDKLNADPWKPIETAPKDGTEILGLDPGVGYAEFYKYQHENWVESQDDYFGPKTAYYPTHWLSLPDPPKESR